MSRTTLLSAILFACLVISVASSMDAHNEVHDRRSFWRVDPESTMETLQKKYPFLWSSTAIDQQQLKQPALGENNTASNNDVAPIDIRQYYNSEPAIESQEQFLQVNSAESLQYIYEKSIEFTSRFTRDYSTYSDTSELAQSALPIKNDTMCLSHLEWLHYRLVQSPNASHIPSSQGIPTTMLARYLDSFGRPEAASYLGNNHWYGAYDECIALRLYQQQQQQQQQQANKRSFNGINSGNQENQTGFKTRYCLGKLNSKSWPTDDGFAPRPTIKVGLCVPQSCDTQFLVNSKENDSSGPLHLLQEIMLINFGKQSRQAYQLVDIYCLPDEQSPIRQLSLSAYAFLVACLLWCSLIIVASFLYLYHEKSHRRRKEHFMIDSNTKSIVYHQIDPRSTHYQQETSNNQHITGKNPLMSTKPPVATCLADQKKPLDDVRDYNQQQKTNNRTNCNNSVCDKILNILAISTSVSYLRSVPHKDLQNRVNLIPLSFLKVLCTLAIVGGHTAHWNGLASKTSKVVLDYLTLDWVQVTLVFAYAVDTFYVMAGILFGYFTMKKLNQINNMSIDTLLQLRSWLGINVLIWFRLSTIYIPVYWFSYSLAVHLGSGPMWDYGTNENSFRGTCLKQTRWYHFILYFSSYGRDHTETPCNEPAWFIETYIKIFLVLPFITYLLVRLPKWSALIVGIIVGTTAIITGWQAYKQTAVSSSYALKYPLSAAVIEAKYTGFSYFNSFTYRLAPVVMGTLAGIYLYRYDVGSIKEWPRWMRGSLSLKLVILIHFLMALEPVTAGYFVNSIGKQNELSLQWNNAISSAKIQPIWCFFNIILILRMTTDLNKKNINRKTIDCIDGVTCSSSCLNIIGNQLLRLMRFEFWIILSRLTFCIYLIHCEIIYFTLSYDYQSRANPNVFRVVKDFLFTIIFSYLVATIVYLMYEAPMDKLIKTIVGGLSRANNTCPASSTDSNNKLATDAPINNI